MAARTVACIRELVFAPAFVLARLVLFMWMCACRLLADWVYACCLQAWEVSASLGVEGFRFLQAFPTLRFNMARLISLIYIYGSFVGVDCSSQYVDACGPGGQFQIQHLEMSSV
jgi:hypothetical protein